MAPSSPERVLRLAGPDIRFRRADGKPMPDSYEARLYTDYGELSCGGLDEKREIAKTRDPLAPGRYHLWIEVPYTGTKSLDMLPGLIRRNIPVRDEKKRQQLEITIPPSAAVQGKVLLADGSPAVHHRVEVAAADGEPTQRGSYAPLSLVRNPAGPPAYASTQIGPDGGFILHGLVEGRYRFAVCTHAWRYVFVSEPVAVTGGRITRLESWKIPAGEVAPR
jgi:hypothetical protein